MPEIKWRQIAEDLRQKIESGELGGVDDNDKPIPLPTEFELQSEYGASRNTVRDAINWLRTRRLVVTRSGQGTFVAQKVDPFITRLATDIADARTTDATKTYKSEVGLTGRKPEVTVPEVKILQGSGFSARELHLPENARMVSRHERRMIDGVPHSRQTSFYPWDFVERGATRLIDPGDIEQGAVSYIEKTTGAKQAGWRDRIRVRTPDDDEAAFFGLPDDGSVPVFEFTRTSYDADGKPFRVTVTTYPADRNQFVMEFGNVPG